MALHRTFSFDNGDEQGLSSNEQERRDYHHNQHHSPYRDSPARPSSTSPPPQYSSPPPNAHITQGSPIRAPQPSQNRWNQADRQAADFHESSQPILDPYRDSPERSSPPRPPPHRRLPSGQESGDGRYWGQDIGYMQRNSAMDPGDQMLPAQSRGYNQVMDYQSQHQGYSNGTGHYRGSPESDAPAYPGHHAMGRAGSFSSGQALTAGAATPGRGTPGDTQHLYPANHSNQNMPFEEYYGQPPQHSPYHDSPYIHTSRRGYDPAQQAAIDPYNIADDGDDGFIQPPKRKSILNIARQSSRETMPAGGAVGAGAGAGAGAAAAGGAGVMRRISTMVGQRNNLEAQDTRYDPVELSNSNAGATHSGKLHKPERSEWLSEQKKGNSKMRWILIFLIGGVIILAIIGGVIGGVIASKNSKKGSGSASPSNIDNADSDTSTNGDLSKDSAEIKTLMNNADLHKVFPAIDYTPWGTQYPLCETYPPSQNNVTRDLAVLSQLTNAVRLYGTDCNQTEMVLHAIDRLNLKDMKVWLGVWIDQDNTTTNERQLSQMYKLLEDTKDHTIFKGVIVGNEVLYRASTASTSYEPTLIQTIKEVKTNISAKGWDLPVATSDLGDNWNGQIVDAVDIVMSNIHPFFAGVDVTQAAAWTMNFWTDHNLVLTKGTDKKQIISETGWPSGGGCDSGSTAPCATGKGAVAGVDEMNTFMADWVCQALKNGTDYFWFEAFDEPWKVQYNEAGKEWEDKWGLMDSARKMKKGLKIPDCGGQTV